MLKKLGLESVDQLFSDVPEKVLFNRPLAIPSALSEIELEKQVSSKLALNKSYPDSLNFLGGGVWIHHVPSIVDEILSRGEFYTAYTPYQPEISQGMLQSMFEYQSQICELTGMEVANSSMYDWSTALGEAGRMAQRVTGRKKILVARNSSPERVAVLRTYCEPAGMEIVPVDYKETGAIDIAQLKLKLANDFAAVYFENPNFFGIIEESCQEISEIAHSFGSLSIVGVNPATLGILRSPGSYGADIVVGDGQPLGVYSNFGGPIIGIFGTRRDPSLLRQMPGRLIGMTCEKTDPSRRGFAMVLQTREQHIRREQATSNICTNEALFALAVSIFLAAMGPRGMKEIGENMIAKSHYAQMRLKEEGFAPHFSGSFIGDLNIETEMNSIALAKELAKNGILGGLPMARFYSDLSKVSVFSFNETHSVEDIEQLVQALCKISPPR